jgi:NTP pyrophosphatase (non-canonical NTP hydrolase)
MSVNELKNRAHETAKSKGFWDEGRQNVAEKLALIASEVAEFEDAWEEDNESDEEVADIVIRCFDLCGYLRIELEEWVMDGLHHSPAILSDPREYQLAIYQRIARAVQAHRKGHDEDVELLLMSIIYGSATFMNFNWFPGRLEQVVVDKMEKNNKRGRLHGNKY